MAQYRPFFSVSDTELILQLSLSNSENYTPHRASDDDAVEVKDDFVFDIHHSLLLDSDKLIIGELMGEGPHSIVYKGWYEFHPVSIKVMLPHRTLDATSECKAKFQREVNLISRIKHKNIVKFIGASIEPSMMIVTELLEGGSLQKHLESIYPRTLGLEQSISFALDISQVMEYLHANGIIHRDLKPGPISPQPKELGSIGVRKSHIPYFLESYKEEAKASREGDWKTYALSTCSVQLVDVKRITSIWSHHESSNLELLICFSKNFKIATGNLLLAEDKMHIKLADFGIAREVICGEMTCEAGTYRYMAPEVFSKEPLPKGAKKCYDHKADVYSFAMVLWALIKNQIPFKGRNEMMAAYATAQNMRPSVEEFPVDILPLLQSCWAEDPNLRPEFTEITQTLTKLLHNCRLSGIAHGSKIETDEDPHRITKEEECPTPRSQGPSPDQSVEHNNKQKHETQNQNDCTEGQSHSIAHKTPIPKKIQKKLKSLLSCLRRCFGFPDMHASSMVVGQ